MIFLRVITLALLSLRSWSLPVENEVLTPSLSVPFLIPAPLPIISARQEDPKRNSYPLADLPPLGQRSQGRPSTQSPSVVRSKQETRRQLLKAPPQGQSTAKPATTTQQRPRPSHLVVPTKRDAECKICPYGSCLNSGILWAGEQTRLSCWTQGDEYNKDRTWVRHQIGVKPEDFCYMSPYDLKDPAYNYRQLLPYCGTKSELNFYLPSAVMKTDLLTECSLCPYRDCEGLEFFRPGVQLDVNCAVLDGWLQVSPSYADGTRKYFRTVDNCYVSLSTVHEVVGNVSESTVKGSTPNLLKSDRLPQCGPIPHLRLTDRPLTSDRSTAVKSNVTPAIPASVRTPVPKPDTNIVTPSYTRTTPRYTPSRPTTVPSQGLQVRLPTQTIAPQPNKASILPKPSPTPS